MNKVILAIFSNKAALTPAKRIWHSTRSDYKILTKGR